MRRAQRGPRARSPSRGPGLARAHLAALALSAAATVLSGTACTQRRAEGAEAASYAEVRAIVDRHCLSCHSDHPTNPAFPIAPNGVTFDTAEGLHRHAAKVKTRTVGDRTMPLLNKTGMTDAERAKLAAWVDDGAEIP